VDVPAALSARARLLDAGRRTRPTRTTLALRRSLRCVAELAVMIEGGLSKNLSEKRAASELDHPSERGVPFHSRTNDARHANRGRALAQRNPRWALCVCSESGPIDRGRC
jgi:hypothetical protein